MSTQLKTVVVLISADAEWVAVKQLLSPGYPHRSPFGEFFLGHSPSNYPQELIFFQGGWGKICAAGSNDVTFLRQSTFAIMARLLESFEDLLECINTTKMV